MGIENHELIKKNLMIQDKKVPPWNITCSSRKVKLTGDAQNLGRERKWMDSSLSSSRELRRSNLTICLCSRAESREGAAILGNSVPIDGQQGRREGCAGCR